MRISFSVVVVLVFRQCLTAHHACTIHVKPMHGISCEYFLTLLFFDLFFWSDEMLLMMIVRIQQLHKRIVHYTGNVNRMIVQKELGKKGKKCISFIR